MIECPQCGARSSAGSAFCTRCGARFTVARPAPVAPEPIRPSGERLLDEASELFATGKLDDAAAACRAALDADPGLVAARSLLGMVEEERGNTAAALAEYEAVLRLAPERTAERERADRVRALLAAEAEPELLDSELMPPRKRWLPIAVAAAAVVLVLLLGLAMTGRSQAPGNTAPTTAGGSPFLPESGAPANTAGKAVAQETPAGEATMDMGLLTGKPIGSAPLDQSANQPNASSGMPSPRSSNTPPPVGPLNDVPMPPPTVIKSNGNGPLTPVPSAAAPPTASHPATTNPAPAPAMESPRGKVRIWMGDEGSGRAATSNSVAPSSGVPAGSSSYTNRLYSNGGGYSASPLTGAPRAVQSGSSAATATQRRSVGSAPAATNSRSSRSSGSATKSSFPRPVTSPGGRTSAVSGSTSTRVAQARASSATPNSGRSSSGYTSGGSNHSNSAGASDLRSRANAAWAQGNRSEARSLYSAALRGYQQESGSNPSRAGANRSAVESCRRALDALDSN
ncbi:MAG: tetratricopeptide repeat protein [Armatimonadia bacterium]